jgi:hypothetical protein
VEARKVAILSFDALVDNYHEVHRWIAHLQERDGAEVSLLSCGRALDRCTNSISLPDPVPAGEVERFRGEHCSKCLRRQSGFGATELLQVKLPNDELSAEQQAHLAELRAVLRSEGQLASVIERELHGLPVARFAFFDFCIAFKVSQLTLLSEAWQEIFLQIAADLLRIANFLRRIESRRFDEIYYTNGNYSANAWVRHLWQQRARFTSIEHVFSCQTFWNRVFFEPDRLPIVAIWPSMCKSMTENSIGPEAVRRALEIFGHRFFGQDFNSYTRFQSDDPTTQKFNAFRERFPTVLALFLSSGDELNSHIFTHGFQPDRSFYFDQSEMLKDLAGRLGPEVGLVVRVHPRLSPNARNQILSREAEEIQFLLKELSAQDNVMVVYPDDKTSSYYLMLRSDLVFITWSTIGMESLVAGKPCLSLFPGNCMYPISELCLQLRDRADFHAVLAGKRLPAEFSVNHWAVLQWVAQVYWVSTIPVPSPRRQKATLPFRIGYRLFRHAIEFPLFVACIFRWFRGCFGRRTAAMMQNVRRPSATGCLFSPPEDARLLEILGSWRSDLHKRFGIE